MKNSVQCYESLRIFGLMNYLDFEEPIKTLREQLEQAKDIQDKNDLNMTTTIEELEVKIAEVTKEIYSKLTPWQRVQVSRHPDGRTPSITSKR